MREQEKQISAAADVVQQTKEDLNLSRDTDTLEEQLKTCVPVRKTVVYIGQNTQA